MIMPNVNPAIGDHLRLSVTYTNMQMISQECTCRRIGSLRRDVGQLIEPHRIREVERKGA